MDAQQMVEIRIERIDNDANGNPKAARKLEAKG